MDQPPPPRDPKGQLAPVDPRAPQGGNALAIYDPLHAYDVQEDEFDLRSLWRTVIKYRKTIAAFMVVVVVTTIMGSLMMRPVYRASALLEIAPNTSSVVKLENVDSGSFGGKGYLETEYNILRSASVGQSVVNRLELWQDPEMSGKVQQRGFKTGFNQLIRALKGQGAPTPASAENSDQDQRARSVLGAYFSRLSVTPVRNSHLFRISFESFTPQLSADVANAVAEEYMRLNDERRFASTSSAKTFLNEEIQRLQAKLETSERELYDFARRHQVVDVEDSNNIMTARLQALNDDLSKVRTERISAESLYLQAQSADAASLPQLLDAPMMVQLKNQNSALQSEYFRLTKVFKEGYPRVQQIRSEMEQIQQQLRDEVARQVEALDVNFRQLKRREQLLTTEVEGLKSEIFELQDRAVQYNILKREWEANRELYRGLLDRLKEVGVASGLEVNNVAIIDRASRPGGKFKPNMGQNVIKASVLGLFGGLALAFLLSFLDNTIRNAEQLEQVLHLANLGLVPLVGTSGSKAASRRRQNTKGARLSEREEVRQLDLTSHVSRDNELAESFRSIRTSLMFSTPEGAPHALLITSASSGEGKTTTAINLATVMAQNGEKVLLVDADLRKPRMHRTFNVPLKPGLTEFLLREPLEQVVQTGIDRVWLMPAGTVPPNPVELLSSKTFDMFLQMVKEQYSKVIIDAPPVLGLADALITGTKVDGVMLVVAAGKVSKDGLRQAVKRLRGVYSPLVGCILNNVDVSSAEYGEYSRYYYSYRKSDDEGKVLRMKRRKKAS